MANPFQVEVPSLYEALLAGERGYKGMRDMQSQNAMSQARQEAQQALAGGGDTRSAMARLIGAGDMQGANALANYGNQDFDRQYKTRQLDLLERSAGRKEIPAGFEPGPTGGLRPIAGGPSDPAYLKATIDAKGKPKDLPFNVIKELGERGGAFGDFTRLSGTFQDTHGGWVSEKLGDAANLAARNLGVGDTKAADWWQDYQSQKNVVRNQLFGSALTATEKTEFDKANINPGMKPELIRTNLQRQHDAAKRAAAKLADSYVKMGYSTEHIEAALGIPLSGLGIAGAAPKAPAAPPTGQISEGRTATNPQTGEKRVYRGGQWVPAQ
jgi:hypothetical protein